MNTLYRYVPELVYNKIKASSYKNKEHLYIICDMLYRVTTIRKEDTDYANEYIDIPASYFRDIIRDGDNYLKAKRYLIDHKIIECDGHYSKINGKALGYRFAEDNISKLTPIKIQKPTLIKRIMDNRNERNNFVNNKYQIYKEHFLSTFKIDHAAATVYINDLFDEEIEKLKSRIPVLDTLRYIKEYEKLMNRYNHLYMSINAINDGELYFTCNTTNNRIDNNLTSLKSELKRFIISNQTLYQIDIVNSQPFLLSLILNEDKNASLDSAELDKYTDWVTQGLFYENFKDEYQIIYNNDIERDEVKTIMFCIFYSKNSSYMKEKSIFKNIFPTIYQWIVEQKEKKHNALAIKMQKFESAICIGKICSKLDQIGIKYYTIHDAWLVNENDFSKTKRIVEDCFFELYKTKPKLDSETIENVVITNVNNNVG